MERTHLGCVVKWHGSEKSWDCKCHGSRFDALGHVLSRPAVDDLHPVDTFTPPPPPPFPRTPFVERRSRPVKMGTRVQIKA